MKQIWKRNGAEPKEKVLKHKKDGDAVIIFIFE